MNPMDANTNKVYRKKYFMDAEKVVFASEVVKTSIEDENSPLIASESVRLDEEPQLIKQGKKEPADAICVEALKDGERIVMLRIKCPCGRHTEINVQYGTTEAAR